MSTDINDDDHKRVEDDDATVDKQIKNAIIRARDRVENREDQVFTQAPLDPEINITQQQGVEIWKTTVVQYLQRIEPLLKSDEIERSDYYYRQVQIADRPVYPPDGETPVVSGNSQTTEDIQWSLFNAEDVSEMDLVMSTEHFGRGIEPPEEKRFKVTGLKDVIEQPQKVFRWEIVLNPDAMVGPSRKIARPAVQVSLSKQELQKAVRLADEFLQQHAGIGVKLDSGDDHGTIS